MIHFFPTFSKDADSSPLGEELRRSGVPYRIFGGHVRYQYRRALFMLLFGYPRLAWFAARSAVRSMYLSDPPPDVVVLGSDVEVLVFSLLRLFRGGRRPRIVLMGFIYTSRPSPVVRALRQMYFSLVLRSVHCVICHSTLETARYREIFGRTGARFVFVPWGTNVAGRQEYLRAAAARPAGRLGVLSAGRSGRDYRVLAEAVRGLDVILTIVCDRDEALAGVAPDDQVRLLRHCYGDQYMQELCAADIVAIPLAVEDISAGQMVLIQAMACGKPVVITRTPTVREYVEDGRTALLVDGGDAGQMRAAIRRLAGNPVLRAQLGSAAQSEYESRFTQAANVRNTLGAIREHCAVA